MCVSDTLNSLGEECCVRKICSKIFCCNKVGEERFCPSWLVIVHRSLTLPCPKGFGNEQSNSAVLADFHCVPAGVHNLLAAVTAIQRFKLYMKS